MLGPPFLSGVQYRFVLSAPQAQGTIPEEGGTAAGEAALPVRARHGDVPKVIYFRR